MKFNVTIARTVTELLYVTVDADDRDEAQHKAHHLADNSDGADWERSEVADEYVHDIFEAGENVESSPQQSPWAGY
jgi:hypothetical protein